MNAPVRAAEVDWDLRPAFGRACVSDPRALKLAARLAAAIVNPFSILPSAAGALPGLPEAVVQKMASSHHFGRPLRLAVSRALNLDATALAPSFFDRLSERPTSRLCVVLMTETLAAVHAAAVELAIAILHRRILMVTIKSDRAKLRLAIGDSGLRLATQEAPMLYSALVDLDRSPHFDKILHDSDEESLKERLSALGMHALCRFVEACEPALRDMFQRRSPTDVHALGGFAESQCEQVLKLFRRRAPSWSAIIG